MVFRLSQLLSLLWVSFPPSTNGVQSASLLVCEPLSVCKPGRIVATSNPNHNTATNVTMRFLLPQALTSVSSAPPLYHKGQILCRCSLRCCKRGSSDEGHWVIEDATDPLIRLRRPKAVQHPLFTSNSRRLRVGCCLAGE